MAAPTDLYKSYESVGNIEDLSDVIKLISPVDTLFYSSLSEGGADNIKVEWQVDALAAAAANAAVEGDAEATLIAASPTTRVHNVCQIQKKIFGISNTNTKIKKAGRVSEKDYETAKKSKELSKDVEYAFLQEAMVAGDATTAREMKGFLNWIVTNLSKASDAVLASTGVVTAGTARDFTEALFKPVLQGCFNAGGNPSIAYLPAALKAIVSGWSQATSNYRVAVEEKKLNATIDVYVSDFGAITFKAHRGMPSGICVVIDPAHKGRKATLRNTHRQQLAVDGDNEKYVIRVEHTLRDVCEAAHARLTDLK